MSAYVVSDYRRALAQSYHAMFCLYLDRNLAIEAFFFDLKFLYQTLRLADNEEVMAATVETCCWLPLDACTPGVRVGLKADLKLSERPTNIG